MSLLRVSAGKNDLFFFCYLKQPSSFKKALLFKRSFYLKKMVLFRLLLSWFKKYKYIVTSQAVLNTHDRILSLTPNLNTRISHFSCAPFADPA